MRDKSLSHISFPVTDFLNFQPTGPGFPGRPHVSTIVTEPSVDASQTLELVPDT